MSVTIASMTLRTYLDHLPEQKQHYVKSICDLIVNSVNLVTEAAEGKKRHSRITHIILFGSYAKGTYVDDPENGYVSDYDILITLNNKDLVEEYGLWHDIEDKAERRVHSPVNLIVHTTDEAAKWLREGQYFFSDIQKEGIYLYCPSNKGLPEPNILSNTEKKLLAEKHFKQWFENAEDFFETFESVKERGKLKQAAFQLHQATERYYNTLLLVLSNYRPKTHNIKRLHSMAIQFSNEIGAVFPQDSRFNRRCLERLKRAYVDARYSEHYVITEEELSWLADQVCALKGIVETVCQDHIRSLA